MPLNTQQIKVHGTLLFVGLIYGATYSIAKIAMPDLIKPFGFILVRVILATLIFWLFDVVKGGEVIRYRRDYIRLMACALFGIAINQLIFFKGLSMTSSISASIIMTSNTIIVLVASWLILKEPVTKLKVAGIILGSTGAVMLILRNEVQWEAGSFLGDLFILINAASYGIYLVLVKPLMARYRAITIVKWVFLFGLIIIIPFGTGELLAVNWYDMPMEGWASILYIILFTTVLAYLLNVWALQFITPTIVSYYIYLQPLFATLIAFVFLNESPGANVIIYTLMIFSGVYLVSKKRF